MLRYCSPTSDMRGMSTRDVLVLTVVCDGLARAHFGAIRRDHWQQQIGVAPGSRMQRRVPREYVSGAIVAIIVHPRARAARREWELGIIRPRPLEIAAGDVHGNAEASR